MMRIQHDVVIKRGRWSPEVQCLLTLLVVGLLSMPVIAADTVWVGDTMPAGAIEGGNEPWNWVNVTGAPFSGTRAHQSMLKAGPHQHYFVGATATLSVGVGEKLFAYVYLDPENPPSRVMLQWNDGSRYPWHHRAYWGPDVIGYNIPGMYRIGALPRAGEWVRLEVPAAWVNLEGRVLNGMAFSLTDGQATWGPAGKASTATDAPQGWQSLPNTMLRSVCPPDGFGGAVNYYYNFHYSCGEVVTAWNSAVMDTARNRLIVWGGGHDNYYGNEVYAVNLNTRSIERLNDPGPLPYRPRSNPFPASGCVGELADGSANTRETFDGLAYVTHLDKMFVFGGAPACPQGVAFNDTWLLDMTTLIWEKKTPSGTIPSADGGVATAYDPNSGKVFVHDMTNLYSYDYATNHFQRLSNNNSFVDVVHLTGVIDPVRKKFVMIGGGQAWAYDIGPGSTFTRQALVTTGGDAIVGITESSNSPGLAYDPTSGRIVAWNGGDTVYSLNLDTNVWTAITHPGAPPSRGHTQSNGTFKRWNYSPASGVFVLVNSMDQNVHTFRIAP